MATESALKFYPLTFVNDPPDCIIGRRDIDSYGAFPEDGANLLRRLYEGEDATAAATWYQEQYGETIDMSDFLETLRELQFLQDGTEEEIVTPAPPSRFWEGVGRAAFSWPAWLVYALLAMYCASLLLRFPYLRPAYSNLFFSPYLVVIELGLFFSQFPAVFLHEGFHVLAGKRLGISSRLGIGRRLYIVVFETTLTGLWQVPRKKRYLPFLAGMLCDIIQFSLYTILASFTASPTNPYTFPGAFFLAMAFATCLRFIWQFYFYLQTDIYYVFSTLLRCVDLQHTTRQYLLNRLYTLLGWRKRLVDETEWHPRDRQVAPWYVWFFALGSLFTVGTLFLVIIPAAVRVLSSVITRLLAHNVLDATFWDSCIFLLLNLIQATIFLLLLVREYRGRKKARAQQEFAEHLSALP